MSVYVFGAGGHAKVVLSILLAAGVVVEALLDDDMEKQGREVMGVRISGRIADASSMSPHRGVLAVGDNRVRRALARALPRWQWLVVMHPNAWIHQSATLGAGTVVFAGGVVQPEARLGEHCIVNTAATVDHDCVVGSFVHLGPGVHLAGSVEIGEGALIGMGSVVLPGVSIGDWAVVGAGAVVTRDVAPGQVVAGVPARVIREAAREVLRDVRSGDAE